MQDDSLVSERKRERKAPITKSTDEKDACAVRSLNLFLWHFICKLSPIIVIIIIKSYDMALCS